MTTYTNEKYEGEKQLNKTMGMICAHALGDALGAPHEFIYQKKNYSGKLEHDVIMKSRWQPDVIMSPGVVTDDTQMAFALMRSISEKGKFDRDDVIKAYMGWANSGVKSLGRNTRALFKGVKTIKGYENRYKKIFAPGEEVTQSNGSLMRAYPLIFTKNPRLDTELTNPNPVNVLCTEVYIRILKDAFNNASKKDTINWLMNVKDIEIVKTAIKEAVEKKDRNVDGKSKGWVLHALYITIYGYLHFNNFTDMYDWIIKKLGDTDTNAAIAGAVKGVELGYNKLFQEQEENLEILFKINPEYFDNIELEALEMTDFL